MPSLAETCYCTLPPLNQPLLWPEVLDFSESMSIAKKFSLFIAIFHAQVPRSMILGRRYSLVNIQKAIENGHQNSELSH